MKIKITLKAVFTFLFLLTTLLLNAQTNLAVGIYKRIIETKSNDTLKYELTLNSDGTFVFAYYSNIRLRVPAETNYSGKGLWSIKNNEVSFVSDKKNDLNDKYTLDFSNSKARFITKSPRDKSDRIIETKLQFLESSLPWVSRVLLVKL